MTQNKMIEVDPRTFLSILQNRRAEMAAQWEESRESETGDHFLKVKVKASADLLNDSIHALYDFLEAVGGNQDLDLSRVAASTLPCLFEALEEEILFLMRECHSCQQALEKKESLS